MCVNLETLLNVEFNAGEEEGAEGIRNRGREEEGGEGQRGNIMNITRSSSNILMSKLLR